MADKNESGADFTATIMLMPLKANGTALAAFFAIVGGLFKDVPTYWLSLMPGWLFLIGMVAGFTVLAISATAALHFQNLNTILGNERTISSVESNPNPNEKMLEIREICLQQNVEITQRLKSDDWLRSHPYQIDVLNWIGTGCFIGGVVLALVALGIGH